MKGDPDCGSYERNALRTELAAATIRTAAANARAASIPKTPDKELYEIVDVIRVGNHIVMKVLYPNCALCSYEGNKVMVFLDVTEAAVIKWRVIDPHFRPSTAKDLILKTRDAPGPNARFPASPEGWLDAIAYATSKK